MGDRTSPPLHQPPAASIRQRSRRGYALTALLGAISAGLHIFAAALLIHWTGPRGTADWAPEVISVSILPTAVLDAASEVAAEQQEAAPSSAADDTREALKPLEPEENVRSEQVAEDETAKAVDAKADAVPALASHVPRPQDTIPAAERKQPERPVQKATASPAPPGQSRREKQPPQRQRHASTSGRHTNTQSGQVTASRGSLADYAAGVRARIARHKPGRLPHSGTAIVSFAISGSGSLIYARLARSSGNPSIDTAALQAVRAAAPFSPTPDGRTFNRAIPFEFR